MADWFVDPETVVIPLPDSQWIEVKKRLTVGESRAAFQQIIGEVNSEGWRRPNLEAQGLAEAASYLVAWSLTKKGKPVPIDTDGKKMSALKNLDQGKFKIISDAIEAHVAAMDAEEDVRKNDQGREIETKQTLGSVAP